MEKMLSITQAAQLLGISRVAVFKKIKSGELKAIRVGSMYVIDRENLTEPYQKKISQKQKIIIQKSVRKTVSEYGEALRRLKDT